MSTQTDQVPRGYAQRPNLFPLAYLDELKAALLSSPYLAANQLSDCFSGSKGFSVVFKRSGIPTLIHHFPYFEPYVRVALKPDCNAFYLNPLILDAGAQVEPHVDCSISFYGQVILIPNVVTVLYVQVPEDLQGGELVLHGRERPLAQLRPQANTLLYFLGQLTHSVNPVQSSQPRISLICEQYNVDSARLASIPEFKILSRAQAMGSSR